MRLQKMVLQAQRSKIRYQSYKNRFYSDSVKLNFLQLHLGIIASIDTVKVHPPACGYPVQSGAAKSVKYLRPDETGQLSPGHQHGGIVYASLSDGPHRSRAAPEQQ
jgi:hypothetical protein